VVSKKQRRYGLALAALFLVFGLAACTEDTPEAQKDERGRQQSNYETLVNQQPAESMSYSPTRETINFWISTWDEPGKLAYVYLQGANGEMLGYYVFQGLPVSYCASLTPTYRFERPWSNNNYGGHQVPAPAMDGVYYAGDGSCNTYYGKDASTGSYVEYTAGLGINVLLYDQPLPRQDVEPLGFTEID
jgi:hypothetical protein